MPKFAPDKLAALKKIDAIFKSIYFFPRNKKVRKPIIDEKVNEILIIAPMMIGDTIMSIPALRILKRNFPNACITLICEQVVKIILEDQGIVDQFIPMSTPWLHKSYSFKNLYRIFSAVKSANKKTYDLAIDFRGDWRNIFLMNFINAKRKVSFNYSGGEYMLTDVVKGDDEIKHYIDEWIYLLKCIGCETNKDDKYPSLHINDTSQQFLNSFVQANKLNHKFVVGIHPGASNPNRKWDEERYANVILNIAEKYSDCVFILFEGPNERESIEKINHFLSKASLPIIVVNESLKKYLALMNTCNLIICNDSGAGHIAGSLNKPLIVLFGKSDPETVKPYNKNHTKIISHLANTIDGSMVLDNKYYLDLITVDEVCDAANKIMDILYDHGKI